MKRFFIHLMLMAFAFYFVFPMLPGFEFHGTFWHAIGVGIFFSITAWLVTLLAVTVSAFLTITSFGTALLYLIPLWLIGFWLFPAVIIKITAELVPSHLTVIGWWPAIWAGFVTFLIGGLTSDHSKVRIIRDE